MIQQTFEMFLGMSILWTFFTLSPHRKLMTDQSWLDCQCNGVPPSMRHYSSHHFVISENRKATFSKMS